MANTETIRDVTNIPDAPPEEAFKIPTAEDLEELYDAEPSDEAKAAGSIGSSLYVGREFTMPEFRAWFEEQFLGSLPYLKIVWHHTWKPRPHEYFGARTVDSLFVNWYRKQLGWPLGVGPHLFLYIGNGSHRKGTVTVYVCTHPQHDGIHAVNGNHRTLGVEVVLDGEANSWRPYYDACRDLSRIVSKGSKRTTLNIPVTFLRTGSGSSKGHSAHKYIPGNSTSCPGRNFDPASFFAHLASSGGSTPPPAPPQSQLHRVQIGAFSVRGNAARVLQRARQAGFSDAFITDPEPYFRVQTGAFGKLENAEKRLAEAKSKGFSDAFIASPKAPAR